MNAASNDLRKVRIIDDNEIAVGMLVAFVIGPGSKPGTVAMERGFIRSIHNGRAMIKGYSVKIDKTVIRYKLEK